MPVAGGCSLGGGGAWGTNQPAPGAGGASTAGGGWRGAAGSPIATNGPCRNVDSWTAKIATESEAGIAFSALRSQDAGIGSEKR